MPQSQDNSFDPPRSQVSDQGRVDGTRELVLFKDGQRYVFTCAPGEESALLAQLRTMARDPESSFSWVDAALLSHQIGVHLRERIQHMD